MAGLVDLIPILVFLAIVMGIWAVLSMISSRNSKAVDRLQKMSRQKVSGEDNDPSSRLTGEKEHKYQGLMDTAKAMSAPLMPQSETETNDLKLKLLNAGFRSEAAPMVFSGLRVFSLGLFFLIACAIALPGQSLSFRTLQIVVFLTGVGFYLPSVVLWHLRKKRQEEIFLSLPDALDLLVVCVESGLGLDAGLRKVTDEMSSSAKTICEELSLCNFQLQMGRARREVLHDLGVRTGVDDVRSLAAILIQADRFGSSIAQALRVQSDSMRTRRKQIAEEKAAKTAVQLLIPLIMFIFPGIFVVLVGPAMINIGDTLMKMEN